MLFINTTAPPNVDTRDSDGEDYLSLCNLPIMTPLQFDRPDLPIERLPPPSPSSNLFEFNHDHGTDMCAADDIFLRGQLQPHKYKPRHTPPSTPTTPPLPSPRANQAHKGSRRSSTKRMSARHVRSESLDGFGRSQRDEGPASRCWRERGSFSAEYQKPGKVAEGTAVSLNPMGSRADSCDGSVSVPARPKWYMFVFGWMTVPAEMAMKDLKSRQKRRNAPPSFSLSSQGRRTATVSGVGCEGRIVDGGGPWWLLRSLSCKGGVDGIIPAPVSFDLT